MNPGYDPQRTRARRRVADTDATAPVDALLGPLPDAPPSEDAPPAAEAPAVPREPLVLDLDAPAPVNVPRHRGRVVLYALAVLSVLAQIAAWIWWRRRRSARPSPPT